MAWYTTSAPTVKSANGRESTPCTWPPRAGDAPLDPLSSWRGARGESPGGLTRNSESEASHLRIEAFNGASVCTVIARMTERSSRSFWRHVRKRQGEKAIIPVTMVSKDVLLMTARNLEFASRRPIFLGSLREGPL
jgi:hypothetical protein